MNRREETKYFWEKDIEQIYLLKNDRFSLLLLEPGEIYFEDFSVFYYSSAYKKEEAVKRKQKGRLKICSKSILFDPLDSELPIIKFLYRDITNVEKWSGSLLSKLDQQGEMFVVEAKRCMYMKEGNIVAPYKAAKEKRNHFFSLNFVNLNSVLPQIQQLLRATTLNPHEATEMVNTIIQSRQANYKFDTSWIEDLYEKIIYETTASKIQPLVCNPGRILLTSKQLYFQPSNNVELEPVLKWKLSSIRSLIKRRSLLRQVGLELLVTNEKEDAYFMFQNTHERDEMFNGMISQDDLNLDDDEQENMTLKWQNGALSNFDYLIYLNSKADRSFNDLTQYPVFPWIIKDYASSKLDFDDPNTFRNLSKPIGALDEQRLNQLKNRCETMPEPKFLYGSHYSSPGFVLFYLVRVAPEYMLCLQNGKFDHPDRLFNSVKITWEHCCNGHSDFKELTPEFYDSSGSFLNNSHHLNLGVRHDGSRVNDVELPPWADDARDFVCKCREALESDYVSQRIHNWIDLVFGYKQRGEEAWKADNVFYYLTYEGAIDLNSMENAADRKCYESQIMEFGQTPKQLFTRPHPKRLGTTIPATIQDIEIENGCYIDTIEKEEEEKAKHIPIVHLDENLAVEVETSTYKWLENVELKSACKLHKEAVLGLSVAKNGEYLFSVSQDTQLKMFSLSSNEQTRSMNLSNMSLACCCLLDNEKHVLIGSWDNNIYVYSVDFARAINSIPAHHDAVSCLCCKNGMVASSSWDSTVKIWSYEKNSSKLSLEFVDEMDHDTEVTCCDLFFNQTTSLMYLATGTKDGTVSIWHVDTMMMANQMNLHTDSTTAVLFNEDGDRILTCSLDQYMKVVDLATEVEVFSKDVDEPIRCACWDGQVVVIGGESGDVMIWNLIKSTCLSRLKSHQGPVRSLAICEQEKTLVSGGADGYLAVWK